MVNIILRQFSCRENQAHQGKSLQHRNSHLTKNHLKQRNQRQNQRKMLHINIRPEQEKQPTSQEETKMLVSIFIPGLFSVFTCSVSKLHLLWQRPKVVSRRWSGEGDDFHWPQGTKDDPATTCYELGITHPDLNDGDWVDVPSDSSPHTKHIRVIAYVSSRLLLYGP